MITKFNFLLKHLFKIFFVILFFCVKCFSQITPSHVVVVILENNPYDNIVGSPNAPYINSLINNGHTALLTNSYGLTHPSQPNYLMLFSGSNQGIVNNNIPPAQPFTTLNLGGSLLNKGYTFAGYSEDLPYTGSNDSVSPNLLYVRKHNPWVNWQGNGVNGIPANDNRPFSSFTTNYNSLPTVSFVVPNLLNDLHDGTIAMCDTWLQNNLDGYVQWCINNNSLFVLTFDEDNTLNNNHIPSFLTGANILPGSYGQSVTHYNILRTLEDLYQLPLAGVSADSSAVHGIWQTLTPVTYTFTGNGNWNVASNWSNNTIPPANIGAGNEIIINPIAGGECVLNVSYTVSAGSKITVAPGKKFRTLSNISIQ